MASDKISLQNFGRGKLSLAISAACAGAAPAASAQDADDGALTLEEIIVTATKRDASLQDVPMSIAAFTDDDIVRAGFKQIGDYVAQIPALAHSNRAPGGSNVVMRGCATSGVAFADTTSTAVYLDEQPITVAGATPDPRLVDIERVEALSGPQGTLFGDGSQCGTLRIITNKPDTEAFDAWVDLSAMSVEDGGTGFDVSAMVNIPFADNKAALRFVGFVAEEPGYIDNVLGISPGGANFPGGTFNNAEFVKKDVNVTTLTGGRLALRVQPGDNWQFDLQAAYQETDADGFGDVDLAEDFHGPRVSEPNGADIGKLEQLRFGDDQWTDEWYQVAMDIEGSLGWADLTIAASFLNRKNQYDADATAYTAYFQEFYPFYNVYDFGGDPQSMSFEDSDQDRISIEVRLATPSDSDSRWSGLIGAFYNKSDDHTHFASNIRELALYEGRYGFYYMNFYKHLECRNDPYPGYPYYCPGYYFDPTSTSVGYATPTVNQWNGVYDTVLEQVAIFGEATFDLTDRFSVTVGGRWFDIKQDRTIQNGNLVPHLDFTTQPPEISCDGLGVFTPRGTEMTDNFCLTGAKEVFESSESGFIPKFTATYNFTDRNMAYATYSEGFRRGGSNAARSRSIFGNPPFNEYKSDLVKNFEIGTKNTAANGRWQFNLTAYHMIWEDMQIEAEDPTPGIFTLGLVNLAEGEINGIEAFLSWLPTDSMKITATYGYNDAKLAEDDILFEGSNAELFVIKGSRLPLSPDVKASVILDYEFQGSLIGSVPSLGITYNYTGDSINSLGGISSTVVVNEVRTQRAYSVTNLRFGLQNDSWSATLFVNNAFNEYAELYYNVRWVQTRLTVNRPRTYGITFRKYFE